jgi:uncharacterized membrane protein YraQ (UPF0718 family)
MSPTALAQGSDEALEGMGGQRNAAADGTAVRATSVVARHRGRHIRVGLGIAAAVAIWIAAYWELQTFADWLTYDLFHLSRGTQVGSAVDFFLTDVPKIFLLLSGIVTVVAVIRSYFPPERVRRLLSGKGKLGGTALAALLGTVTPFCSCSAVPMFIGFVESGLPLGVTFDFLIASPVVNEVALVMLAGLFGIQIAVFYVGMGLVVAIVGGTVIGHLHLEDQVEDYVYRVQLGASSEQHPDFSQRLGDAIAYTRDILRRVFFPWVLGGIAVGAWIHGYAPTSLVVQIAGRGNPFAVPLAVLLAIPLYSNAAGTIPIVQALIQKGLPMGTTLAFMMAITAISTPEMIILRRVIKWKLIAVFITVVTLAIIAMGYVFNAVL